MYSEFKTRTKAYILKTDKFICNKFGLAEFFAQHYEEFKHKTKGCVLDVGCGAGPICIYLADDFSYETIGVELNPTAYQCCKENIDRLGLAQISSVLNEDFSKIAIGDLSLSVDMVDMIVANPPIDNTISNDEIQKYVDFDYSLLDSNSFSYITNSWHSADGLDLVDYIFIYAQKHLKPDGNIFIIFCMIDCDSPDYVTDKAQKYGFYISEQVCGQISPESIGAESFISTNITTYMISFERGKNYGDQNT